MFLKSLNVFVNSLSKFEINPGAHLNVLILVTIHIQDKLISQDHLKIFRKKKTCKNAEKQKVSFKMAFYLLPQSSNMRVL